MRVAVTETSLKALGEVEGGCDALDFSRISGKIIRRRATMMRCQGGEWHKSE